MNRRLFIASFASEHDILGVTREVVRRGYRIGDIFTPYPVHGLAEAMGLRQSRLPWVCFICGLLGALIAIHFQGWLSAVDWPLSVGGKPWNSWPAFIPIAFEITVLFAGLGTVAALLLRYGLLPGRKPKLIAPLITDSRFVLVLVEEDAAFDAQEVAALCREHHAVDVEERMDDELARTSADREAAWYLVSSGSFY